jgi:predicted metalloprotease with PDZ domain
VRSLAIAGTVAVHALILAVALVRCTPEVSAKPPPPPQAPQDERVLSVHLLPSGESVTENALACEYSYRGVGFTGNGVRIESLAPGGPAESAGLQVGDVVLNSEVLGQDRYMVGHRLTLQISRSGRQFAVEVVIRRICFE